MYIRNIHNICMYSTVSYIDCNLADGSDYHSGPYLVTFSPGQTIVPFNVSINDDEIFEGNETFNLSINAISPSGVISGNITTVIIIVDDEHSKYLAIYKHIPLRTYTVSMYVCMYIHT